MLSVLTTAIRVMPAILDGNSRIALAVTEPDAGSDVAGLQTEAKLSDDGSHFIVNGQKKVCSGRRVLCAELGLKASFAGQFGADANPAQPQSGSALACTPTISSPW